MQVRITLERSGVILATAIEEGVGREVYVSTSDKERLPRVRAALDPHMTPRQAGATVNAVCHLASGRHMAWRHREDEPMLRETERMHWAPGSERQWREEEKWLPEGHVTLTIEILTDAAAALDIPLAA